MNVISKISVDLIRANFGGRVNAMQCDGNTRTVEITLLAGGAPWTPPADAEAAIAYRQPGGTKGLYNKLADGTPAISINGNVATIILAPQMLTAPGTVQVSIVFNDAQLNQLTAFPFYVSVEKNPYVGSQKTEDYIRLQWLEDKLDEYIAKVGGGGTVDPEAVRQIVINYLTANPPTVTETDPTVPPWAKQPQKPTYTADEVHALPDTYTPPDQTAQQVGADPAGTAASAVSQHNTDTAAHNDLRLALKGLSDRVNAALDSDDTTLDQMSEVVSYIKSNKSLLDAITTSKVSITDIVNDLVTNVADKPLSAAQGVVLKGLIDELRTLIPEAYTLPTATETTLGGVKPVTATDAMTQPVGVTTEGRLVTKPGEGGSGIAVTGATVGQTVKIAAVDDNGVPTAWEPMDAPSGGVTDVQLNGNSVVSDGVANIPFAGAQAFTRGTFSYHPNYGLDTASNSRSVFGLRRFDKSVWDGFRDGQFHSAASRDCVGVSSDNADYAVKTVLCDGKGDMWTDVERIAALLRMGCTVDDNGFVKWTAQEVTE